MVCQLYKMEVHCVQQCNALHYWLNKLIHILPHSILHISFNSLAVFSVYLKHVCPPPHEKQPSLPKPLRATEWNLFKIPDPLPGFNTQIKYKQTDHTIQCHNP